MADWSSARAIVAAYTFSKLRQVPQRFATFLAGAVRKTSATKSCWLCWFQIFMAISLVRSRNAKSILHVFTNYLLFLIITLNQAYN